MMMAVNTIRIKKGQVAGILARFKTAKSVHTFDGFIVMEVLKKENSPDYDELKICTTWQSHKFFDRWIKSRESQKSHANKSESSPEENPIISSELTTFEVAVQHLPA